MINKAKYRNRLLRLAKYLESIPEESFDYSYWFNKSSNTKAKCRTTACAFGHATFMPEFKKLGLCLIPRGESGFDIIVKHKHKYNNTKEAAKFIFGINTCEFFWIFIDGSECPYYLNKYYNSFYKMSSTASAKDVAKHIRRFVKATKHFNNYFYV